MKEVLERMGVAAVGRAVWPVIEWQGEIVWMQGAELEVSVSAERVTIVEVQVSP